MKTPTDVPKDWLKTKITVEQAETKHMVQNPRPGEKPVPFGFGNEYWPPVAALARRRGLICNQAVSRPSRMPCSPAENCFAPQAEHVIFRS